MRKIFPMPWREVALMLSISVASAVGVFIGGNYMAYLRYRNFGMWNRDYEKRPHNHIGGKYLPPLPKWNECFLERQEETGCIGNIATGRLPCEDEIRRECIKKFPEGAPLLLPLPPP